MVHDQRRSEKGKKLTREQEQVNLALALRKTTMITSKGIMRMSVGVALIIVLLGNAITFNSLTVNSAQGVSLSQDATVNGTLTLTTGTVSTGNNTLTVGASGTVARTNGYVIGALRKLGFTGAKVFEVGTANGYTPVQMTATGTGDFTVRTNQGKHPNRVNENVLGMYWTLTNGGITSADLTFKYLDTDVNGSEASYDVARWDGASWFLQSATVTPAGDSAVVLGVTTFSDWTLGEPASLPIQLSSFTGVFVADGVRLDWRTASEVNNYGFFVQKKLPNETAWSEITNSFVAGHGTTNEPQAYTFLDRRATRGLLLYRLKQVDLDGSIHFTEPIHIEAPTSVNEAAPIEFSLKQNYPNPFNPSTRIKFSVEKFGRAELVLYNALGQEVAQLFDGVAEPGQYYSVTLNGSHLASGIYFYKLQTENKSQMKKLVLLK